MNIVWHEKTRQFHLNNDEISYIMYVQPNGEMGQLYFGSRIHDREDFTYLSHRGMKSMVAVDAPEENFSMELNRQEYPGFGSTDFGMHAFEAEYADASRVSNCRYLSHKIFAGKEKLDGLPAAYAEEDQAMTLVITMEDPLTKLNLELSYSIFRDLPVITRNVRFINRGDQKIVLNRAMSACIDLPDQDYEWMQFSGAWARERIPATRKIERGMISVESKRGGSSANHNPFIIVKRPHADDFAGEAIGMSFVYSGNFLAAADADTYGRLRLLMGIHPDTFRWPLEAGAEFTAPEVVVAYTDKGLNDLSQTFHSLFNNHLVRGKWKNKARPILLNNWEATFMDFTQDSILKIAAKAKEAGAELFVLDDGWFGKRDDDYAGLGDWVENPDKLPGGMKELAGKVNELGLEFGFWIEPEMVNPDSDLYRAHPDWAFAVPGREPALGRHQYVLDFSRDEVVDYIYDMLYKVIDGANISYMKWDMNRALTDVYSKGTAPELQGCVSHKYVLGVYRLYEKLIAAFPDILFESCSSGGSRFDAGMLYYAPQAWCSDNTDGADRVLIQYGSSYGYPISSIGAHVSAVPNQQTGRSVPIQFRADVACFGTFGYELDLNELSDGEFEQVKEQIVFMKKYRQLLQFGRFYRLVSPFETDMNAWMVVSEDKKQALVGVYTMRASVNGLDGRIRLAGLDEDKRYHINTCAYYGDELMRAGLLLDAKNALNYKIYQDYSSCIICLNAE
ncbi:MAG: alpha-galactosidase [Eubacterium sp.]|nr:alpha-galactosidase [Eubacterium sp.]